MTLEEKRAKFEQEPDKFICLDELIVAAKRGEDGVEIYTGRSNGQLLMVSLVLIQRAIDKALTFLEIQKLKENKIITPKVTV